MPLFTFCRRRRWRLCGPAFLAALWRRCCCGGKEREGGRCFFRSAHRFLPGRASERGPMWGQTPPAQLRPHGFPAAFTRSASELLSANAWRPRQRAVGPAVQHAARESTTARGPFAEQTAACYARPHTQHTHTQQTHRSLRCAAVRPSLSLAGLPCLAARAAARARSTSRWLPRDIWWGGGRKQRSRGQRGTPAGGREKKSVFSSETQIAFFFLFVGAAARSPQKPRTACARHHSMAAADTPPVDAAAAAEAKAKANDDFKGAWWG